MTFNWVTEDARRFLSRGYLKKGQTVEERVQEIADAFGRYVGQEKAGKFYEYMSKGWISLSSPVWSNYGNSRGLPISCNGSYIDDTIEDILYKTAEIGTLSKLGAGTSAYLGAIRPLGSEISVGGTADGPVRFAELLDKTTDIISQGNVRRGHCAVWLDVEHPDIKNFLKIQDVDHPVQHLTFGVCISDQWMNEMLEGDKKKREIWTKIIQKRFEKGYPFIFFTDNVNEGSKFDEKIFATNMCTEICLPSDRDHTFVCCLSSLNLLHWDEWKSSDLVELMIEFLDTVMEEYIRKTEGIKFLDNARRFAIKYRALGLGTLGWHSYLQSKMIPFESLEAKLLNAEIYRTMRERAEDTSMGRNHTLLAIAPTTSSSFILGVSPSIEPFEGNAYTDDLAKGKFLRRNPHLKSLLIEKGKNTEEVWDSIIRRDGSVQHLPFLSDYEKNVFKTFGEISQAEIITQAAQRQKFIDQAQSINIKIHPDADLIDVHSLMVKAWELKVKTLYYQRSVSPTQELSRNLLDCTSCEA